MKSYVNILLIYNVHDNKAIWISLIIYTQLNERRINYKTDYKTGSSDPWLLLAELCLKSPILYKHLSTAPAVCVSA